MKRSAPSNEGGSKLKQMKLFDDACDTKKSPGGGSGSKNIEAVWKEHGEAVKGLRPLLYMTPKDLAGKKI